MQYSNFRCVLKFIDNSKAKRLLHEIMILCISFHHYWVLLWCLMIFDVVAEFKKKGEATT